MRENRIHTLHNFDKGTLASLSLQVIRRNVLNLVKRSISLQISHYRIDERNYCMWSWCRISVFFYSGEGDFELLNKMFISTINLLYWQMSRGVMHVLAWITYWYVSSMNIRITYKRNMPEHNVCVMKWKYCMSEKIGCCYSSLKLHVMDLNGYDYDEGRYEIDQI